MADQNTEPKVSQIVDESKDDSGQDEDAREDARKDELLKTARARLELAEEAESEIRKAALEDLEFRAGKQWPESIEQERSRDGRPCLVINRIPQFIQQVTNDQRQNRPSIKVHPIDDAADIETAKVIQGLVRHIEYNSNADSAYDTAFEGAVGGGFGYFRIETQFASPTSFDQEILIKRIRNQFSVFFDPYSQEPDGSDANWAFVTDDLSPEDYRAQYPDSELAGDSDWSAIGNQAPGWIKDGAVRVAEYFYKVSETKNLCLLSNGEIVFKEHLEQVLQIRNAPLQGQPQDPTAPAPKPVTCVRERKSEVPVIKWCKLNALEILEETEWPGIYIPIIPVYGCELFINGKRTLESVIRNAKDPQRMYNYWKSAQTETIALAPRAPFIGAEGQFEGREEMWKTANRRNHAYLEYKPVSLNGQPQPPPQRQAFEPAVQAITQAAAQAADDLKATTGIYDPSLGAQRPDQSGIAIQRLNNQSQTSNFHFVDNLTRSLKHTGRILVDLIPRIYDTARAARIIGDDGEQKVVQINQPFDLDGKPVLYQLDAGRYDATVDVGPSFASKRQEAAASMLELSKSYPPVMQVAGDLLVKNMDWPGAQEIADRLRKMLPPNLQDDGKKGAQIPPQVQAQMQHMGQMIDQMTKELHDSSQTIETKRLELESRERIAMAQIKADIEISMAKMGSQESLALLNHQIGEIETRMKMLHVDQPIQDLTQTNSFAPQAPGAPGADGGPTGAIMPTGGSSPGQPMEGNPHVDPSTQQ